VLSGAEGHDRINVQNNPVNWIDPLGLEADNLNPIIRNAVNVMNIIDVLPVGMIPGAGPTVGEFLDISAFAGAQAILIRDVMAKDINGVQFFIGSTLME